MNSDQKATHLIERAAARLALPWGEAAAQTGPAVEAVVVPDAQRVPKRRRANASGPAQAAAPIPREALLRAGLMDHAHRHSRIAEEFRIVQSRLLREAFGGAGATAAPRRNLVLVTSALSGEGKSFVTLNLAAGLARQGDRRVLLVDTDIKRGSLGQLMGVSAAPGLLDLIRSPGEVEDLIVPTAATNLDVLPLGSGVEESAELFAGKRMAELLDDLSRRYAERAIIIDASPCLSSSNPHVLAALVGQVILVVAAGSTQQGDIEAALEMVQNCANISLLLNKIAAWNLHSFGAYSYPLPAA